MFYLTLFLCLGLQDPIADGRTAEQAVSKVDDHDPLCRPARPEGNIIDLASPFRPRDRSFFEQFWKDGRAPHPSGAVGLVGLRVCIARMADAPLDNDLLMTTSSAYRMASHYECGESKGRS